jgi:hypothetical protein
LAAFALILSGCIGPGYSPKGEAGNASIELVYTQGFDLKMADKKYLALILMQVNTPARYALPQAPG